MPLDYDPLDYTVIISKTIFVTFKNEISKICTTQNIMYITLNLFIGIHVIFLNKIIRKSVSICFEVEFQ